MLSEVERVLDDCRGVPFCHACLALKLGASLLEMQATVAALVGRAGFVLEDRQCSSCLRHVAVVVAAAPSRAP